MTFICFEQLDFTEDNVEESGLAEVTQSPIRATGGILDPHACLFTAAKQGDSLLENTAGV